MTRRFSFSLLAIFLFAAAASAQTFTAQLNSLQEVPANASAGKGYGRVFVNPSTLAYTFEVVFYGLSSNQAAAHIHAPAPVGVNAGVIINLGAPGGTANTISGGGTMTLAQLNQLKAGQAYINVHTANFSGGEIRGQLGLRRVLDYDGDGMTDYSVLRFPNVAPPGHSQITYWNRNSQGLASNQTVQWGNANTDFPCPGDYDGDAKDDFCVYRAGASAGQQSFFYITRSSDLAVQIIPFGIFGDQAINRDYDGDGRTDIAVFRPGATAATQTRWFILNSSNQSLTLRDFGLTGNGTSSFDTPIPGDYDGDGKFDIAIYRFGQNPANNYIVLRSSDGVVTYQQWGNFTTDYVVPGDYDGDGKFDLVAVRTGATATAPMVWHILQSSNNQYRNQTFGFSSDLPTQGDFDGDGKTDIGVWRRGASAGAQSFYHVFGSLNGYILTAWGLQADFTVNTFDTR